MRVEWGACPLDLGLDAHGLTLPLQARGEGRVPLGNGPWPQINISPVSPRNPVSVLPPREQQLWIQGPPLGALMLLHPAAKPPTWPGAHHG